MNTILKQKLEENKERRETERLLKLYPDHISTLLKESKKIYSHQFWSKFPISPLANFVNGILEKKTQFEIYIYLEYDHIDHILDILYCSNFTLNNSMYIYFGKGQSFYVESKFNMDFIRELITLSSFKSISCIMIVNSDFKKGIFIDTSGGYIREDRITNDDEIIYEFTYFDNPLINWTVRSSLL